MKFVVLLLPLFFFGTSPTEVDQNTNIDYYWRDYTGEIPHDAFPGGTDLNNKTTYIGQGFVGNIGNLPGIIYPGQLKLFIPEHGVSKVDGFIKILCSPKIKALKWYPVTNKNFKMKTTGKYLVVGGNARNSSLNIGRVAFKGEVLTGKVVPMSSYYTKTSPMFVVYNDKEYAFYTFEVLVYDMINE